MPAVLLTPSLLALAVLTACGASGANGEGSRSRPPPLHGSHWTWLDASCSDGALELGSLGLERSLTLEVAQGGLRLTHETEIVTEGCRVLEVWSAEPAQAGELWRFVPEATVTLPPDAECGPRMQDATEGTLTLHDDVLEIATRRSPWCRGFDARFSYRRDAIAPPLTPEGLAERYVAHWNRADAAAIGRLFVDQGSLVEPFTRTVDGRYARHAGRQAVQAWHQRAFASAHWHAMRLLAVEPTSAPNQWALRWEYIDDHLAKPLLGRNLFVVAGGEIYEAEVQLVSDPAPRAADPAPAPAVVFAPEAPR